MTQPTMNGLSLLSACVLWRQRDWGFRICYWLVFLKVVDIRNGEQLKDSFTLIFRGFRAKTRTTWLVLHEENILFRGQYQEKMQPWKRAGNKWQVGSERNRPGSICHWEAQKGMSLELQENGVDEL